MESDFKYQLYTLTIGKWKYYINPTADGLISWWSIQYESEYLEEAFENCQQGGYENFSIRSTTIIATNPIYDGNSYLHNFLVDLEDKVALEHRISILDIALKFSPARWWAMHKKALNSWYEIKLSLKYRFFLPSQVIQSRKDQELKPQLFTLASYDGSSDPQENVVHCIKVWEVAQLPSQCLVHHFIYLFG
jgi:hypothetical protein